jgi:hypothetical protein
MLRSPIVRAIRNRVARAALAVPPLAERAGLKLSGIGISYDRPRGSHCLVGTRAPDVTGTVGTRLYEALRGGRFVLVGPPGFAPVWHSVTTLEVTGPGTPMLVRPDGYVAWAGPSSDGLDTALSRWGAATASGDTGIAAGTGPRAPIRPGEPGSMGNSQRFGLYGGADGKPSHRRVPRTLSDRTMKETPETKRGNPMNDEPLIWLKREVMGWLGVHETRNEHGPFGIGVGSRRRVQC